MPLDTEILNEIKKKLDNLTPGVNYSTTDIVEELFAGDQQVYKVIQRAAIRELAAYATRGPERSNRFGGMMRPWLWHTATTPNDEFKPGNSVSYNDAMQQHWETRFKALETALGEILALLKGR